MEEKKELQLEISEMLISDISTTKSLQRQSQSFRNVSIDGNNIAADFGQKQVIGGNITSPQKVISTQDHSVQEALSVLAELKQAIINNDNLDVLQKATTEAQVRVIENELNNPEPDKGLVSCTISTLKKGLGGVLTLAEPVMKVANLVAKAWGIPVP